MPTAVEFESAATKLHDFAKGLPEGEQGAIAALIAAAMSATGEVHGFAELDNYAADLNKFGILIQFQELEHNPGQVNRQGGFPILVL